MRMARSLRRLQTIRQPHFDQRWRYLCGVPRRYKVHFLRASHWTVAPTDWLISGGESGGGARPLKPQWVRDVIADCLGAGRRALSQAMGQLPEQSARLRRWAGEIGRRGFEPPDKVQMELKLLGGFGFHPAHSR